MNSGQCKGTEEQGVKFVPTRGSLIGGIAKEKTARITDAISRRAASNRRVKGTAA